MAVTGGVGADEGTEGDRAQMSVLCPPQALPRHCLAQDGHGRMCPYLLAGLPKSSHAPGALGAQSVCLAQGLSLASHRLCRWSFSQCCLSCL